MSNMDIFDSFEDLLAFDDLFLDYFNDYLCSPVFPEAVKYNRLTNTFENASQPGNGVNTSLYGATDDERDIILQWAQLNRLQSFTNSDHFRLYRLCKLLSRPIDLERSGRRSGRFSSRIRGYSREAETYISTSSLSGSVDNSGAVEDSSEPTSFSQSHSINPPEPFLFRSARDSRPVSQPSLAELNSSSASSSVFGLRRARSANLPASNRMDDSGRLATDAVNLYKGRTLPPLLEKRSPVPSGAASDVESETTGSTWHNDSKSRTATIAGKTHTGNRSVSKHYVTFEEYATTDTKTGSTGDLDVDESATILESQVDLPLQVMKELVFTKKVGLDYFEAFLRSTPGWTLMEFWLESEKFRDLIKDKVVDGMTKAKAVIDNCRSCLSQSSLEELTKATDSNMWLAAVQKAQYDVLRRLRTYWVSRFLIHLERTRTLEAFTSGQLDDVDKKIALKLSENFTPMRYRFHNVFLGHTLRLTVDDLLRVDQDRFAPSAFSQSIFSLATHVSTDEGPPPPGTHLERRFANALAADEAMGFPFLRYIQAHCSSTASNSLQFLLISSHFRALDVDKNPSDSRVLKIRLFRSIMNDYLNEWGKRFIGATFIDTAEFTDLLTVYNDTQHRISCHVFDPVRMRVIADLQRLWIQFLKFDLLQLTIARYHCRKSHHLLKLKMKKRPLSTSTSNTRETTEVDEWFPSVPTIDEILFTVAGNEIRIVYIEPKKPKKEKKVITVDPIKLEQRKREMELWLKQMEKERQKALKAAKKQAAKKKKARIISPKTTISRTNTQTTIKTEKTKDQALADMKIDGELAFTKHIENKGLMAMFRNYLQGSDHVLLKVMNIFGETTRYLALAKDSSGRREGLGQSIGRFFTGRDADSLNKTLNTPVFLLQDLKQRPQSANIKNLNSFLAKTLDREFQAFLRIQSEEIGVDANDIVSMSTKELELVMGTGADRVAVTTRTVKRSKRAGAALPKATVTKQDRAEFQEMLRAASRGPLPIKLAHFYEFLVDLEDFSCPQADNDLLFCIEAGRFKECCFPEQTIDLLKHKIECIVEVYIESVTPPTLQIDIKADVLEKLNRSIKKLMSSKSNDPTDRELSNLFDDAQFALFGLLVQFYAEFSRNYSEMVPRGPTRRQLMLQQRLELFLNTKPPSPIRCAVPQRIRADGQVTYTFSLVDGLRFKDEDEQNFFRKYESQEVNNVNGPNNSSINETAPKTNTRERRRSSIYAN